MVQVCIGMHELGRIILLTDKYSRLVFFVILSAAAEGTWLSLQASRFYLLSTF